MHEYLPNDVVSKTVEAGIDVAGGKAVAGSSDVDGYACVGNVVEPIVVQSVAPFSGDKDIYFRRT